MTYLEGPRNAGDSIKNGTFLGETTTVAEKETSCPNYILNND